MSDDLDAGVTSTPDPVTQVQDAALSEMAKSENIENYAKERADRDAEANGEEIDDEARADRIRKALSEAREQTKQARSENGLDQPDLDQQYQSAEAEWNQAEQSEQAYESEREQARAEGRFTATAEILKASNPQAHADITNSLGALDVMMQPEQLDVLRREMVKRRSKRKFGSSASANDADRPRRWQHHKSRSEVAISGFASARGT